MNDDFLETIAQTIAAESMLSPGDRVLVAWSGGGDSTALFHALLRLGYKVHVAHLDHGSREDSSSDAEWVAAQARAHSAPFVTGRCNVAEEARALGASFEAHARAVRYAFLARAAREQDCAAVATGHTASDQAETVLLRVVRGTGPGGLTGIPPVGAHMGVRVVRPLLLLSRERVRQWAAANELAWIEDPSNRDTQIVRNRVRQELLPLLRGAYNPSMEAALQRLAEAARCDESLLRPLAQEAWLACVDADGRIARAPFKGLHPALQRRVVMAWFEARGLPTAYGHVVALAEFVCAAPVGAKLSLPEDRLVYAGRDHVEPVANDAPSPGEGSPHSLGPAPDPVIPRFQLPIPGEAVGLGVRLVARRIDIPERGELATRCNKRRQCFDAEALGGSVTIRARCPGDRMVPLGAPGRRKVSDIMVDAGIPAPRRGEVPLLVKGDTVLWIAGGPVAQCAAITEHTRAAVEVEIVDAPE